MLQEKPERSQWPKVRPMMTAAQKKIDEDWQAYWLPLKSNRFNAFTDFGHQYVLRHSSKEFVTSLEVGAGIGEHFPYERLNVEQKKNYWFNDARSENIQTLKKDYPFAQTITADCQKKMPFADGFFNRIIAVHVLEHLDNLPEFLREAHRLLNAKGKLLVVVPSEGWVYALARRFTTQKMFERRYGMSFKEYMSFEHLNHVTEVLEEVRRWFEVEHSEWWPFRLPWSSLNVNLGLTLRKKR